jgi:hypothetical protein
VIRSLWAAVIVLAIATPIAAQNARDGRLVVTVADQTGAVLPGATVTLIFQDTQNAPPITPATTSTQGVVTFQTLAQGRYTVRAEFEGFDPASVRDVRVRAGENRQNVVLRIANLQDSITVGQDRSNEASDRRGPTFGTVLTREQIDALSEDPDEAARQLQELAGPGAVMRVDSFEGSALPPKSQIRMIRISRDQFAAENHSAGGLTIDIVTQPGLGPIRGSINTNLRDGSMTGRSPFVDKKGPERSQNYNMNLSGALVQGKTSFSLNLGGNTSFDTPNLNATNLDGQRSEALGLRRPRQGLNGSVTVDHALTLDQTLRFGFNQSSNTASNLGIGDYDYVERAFETEGSNFGFRAQHVGPLGRRFFMNNRVQVNGTESVTRSSVEAPTIRVLDAFTSGGAQQTGGTTSRRALVNSDLDYVRGVHSIRTGIALDSTWYRTDSTSNYLGTYTFENLEAFEQSRPRSYTRRIGDPNISYFNLLGGFYVQDDIRVRRNLSLSPGVRYEAQTHVSDFNNIGPRLGVTWSPGASGRTSLRASAGIFYDWLGTGTYEQTLRVDGFRQRELNIANPLFPDPEADGGIIPPVNRYLLGESVRLPRQVRFSGGAERNFGRARLGFTWAHMRGTSLRRGENLNAPVNGVRPNPEFGNIIRVVSDAGSRQNTSTVFFNVNLARQNTNPTTAAAVQALLAAQRTAPRFDWRRASITTQYTNNWLRNNTDGDFWVAPTGSLEDEWGIANGDVRHRWIVQLSSQFMRNLTTSFILNASSGSPYTLQTGRDDNGDLIFNDRPDGVARNTERAAAQLSLNGNFNYSFTFGRTNTNAPPQTGIVLLGGGAAPNVQSISVPQQGRYRVGVSLNATNITNRANYVGYSGIIGSPYFGKPRDVANPRRFDVSVNFGF